jgi:hypothetical protein
MTSVVEAIGFWFVIGFPLLVTMTAFLDVVRRPRWAWAMAGRSQTTWMAILGGAALTWLGGMFVALWYFSTAGRAVARAERGDLRSWVDPGHGGLDDDQPPES